MRNKSVGVGVANTSLIVKDVTKFIMVMMVSKDIHKWSDGRYTLMFDEHTFFVWDNEKDERMTALETTERLNMQQATIQELEEEIKLLKPTNIEQYEQIQKLQEEIGRLEKIIDLTQYQLKVQDRILKEVGE